jgi:hypothetical protein
MLGGSQALLGLEVLNLNVPGLGLRLGLTFTSLWRETGAVRLDLECTLIGLFTSPFFT